MLIVAVLVSVVVLGIMMFSQNDKGSKKQGAGPSSSVSYARRSLMTAREREFFVLLRGALPTDAEIYAQVSMGALIDVAKGARSDRNRFDRKVFDFVVCSAGGLVLYVVELDDRSHATKSAQHRDTTKNDICAAAGLPLVRYQSVRTDTAALRADFERHAGVTEKAVHAVA